MSIGARRLIWTNEVEIHLKIYKTMDISLSEVSPNENVDFVLLDENLSGNSRRVGERCWKNRRFQSMKLIRHGA